MTTVHSLKTDSHEFQAVADEIKTHDTRLDDRGFHVGDYLILKETVSTGEEMKSGLVDHPLEYTGSHILARITHMHEKQGMLPQWKVLSITILDKLLPSVVRYVDGE